MRLNSSLAYRVLAGMLVLMLSLMSSFSLPVSAKSGEASSSKSTPIRQPFGDSGTPGVTTTGEKGVSETTSQIMAREQQNSRQVVPHTRKRLMPNQNKKQNPASPAVASTGDSTAAADSQSAEPGAAGPLLQQSPSISFTGATLADTGAFPPDTMGTVGPSQFVVAVNGRFRTFNKATGVADGVLNANPDTFFASVETPVSPNFTSDPRVRYDRLTQRWILIIIDVPNGGAGNNRVLLAVSDAASQGVITANTVWTFFFFQGDATNFADYPTLGLDNNALYIGTNMFDPNSNFVGTNGYVVKKSSILGTGPIKVTTFAGLVPSAAGSGPATPQGVDNQDPTATVGYFIGPDNAAFGQLDLRRVSNPGTDTPTISGNIIVTVPTTYYPNTVPHLGNTQGTNGQLDALDDRLFAATIKNGELWTAHNILVNTSGVGSSTGTRDGSRWYHLTNLGTTPTLVESGTVYDNSAANPVFYWIPSINVSGQGHAVMGFSSAGATQHINAAVTGRLAGDAAGTLQSPPFTYTNSTTAYNPSSDPGGSFGRRWGDYSYTSVDPEDDMTMWTIQEFNNATNTYGVRALKLLAPPPATPSSASSAATGQASVNVTVNGVVSAGSGFFDPGAGFTKHISATVSGGVVVNSVTYVSPTSVTLNISTVGASTGAKDVTIINPDGQSSTGVGILTLSGGVVCTNPQQVSSPADDGSCNTLRQALTAATNSTGSKAVTITLSAGSVITLTTGLTLTSGVSITTTAPCGVGPNNSMVPPITLKGGTGDGLTLAANNSLFGLWVRGFSGVQIRAPLGSSTHMQCVRASKL